MSTFQAELTGNTQSRYASHLTILQRLQDLPSLKIITRHQHNYRIFTHIVLLGDSIFDNEPYVASGDTVTEQLSDMAEGGDVSLLAVDGDVTTGVQHQLRKLPSTATHLFVSCGGNDALQCLNFYTVR